MDSLDIRQLLHRKRDMPTSFILKIHQQSIDVGEIKRLLPQRRISAIAKWQGKIVFIKLFFGKNYQRYAKRELNGLRCFARAGVEYPQLLADFDDSVARATLLIFECIENSYSISMSDVNQDQLQAIIQTISRLHQKNILQTDIHLDNFLFTTDKLYIIDAGMVQQFKKPLSIKQRIHNLAAFFIEFSPLNTIPFEQLLNHYEIKIPLIDLEKEISKQRYQRAEHYINKKVFRNCTAFLVRKKWAHYFAIKRDLKTAEIELLCQNPDHFLEKSSIIKSGRTAKVGIVTLAGKKYLLKRYNRKNWLHFIARSLSKSRAAVSWQNGHLLALYQVETPTPVALIEQRFGFFKGKSWLLLEFDEGMDLLTFFSENKSVNSDFIEQLKQFILILPKTLISHGDFKAPNVLVNKKGDLSFIDLDGMQLHPHFKSFYPQYLKDLKRLERDIKDRVGAAFFDHLK